MRLTPCPGPAREEDGQRSTRTPLRPPLEPHPAHPGQLMEVGFSPWGCKETQLSDFSLCVAGEVGKVGIGIQPIHMWMRDLFPLGVCFPTCEMGRWTTFSSYQTEFQGLGAGKTRGRPRVSKSLGPALSRAALLAALQFFFKAVLLPKSEKPGLDGCLGFLGSYQPCPIFPSPSSPGQ